MALGHIGNRKILTMAECKKCNKPAPNGQPICDDCLNNWQVCRQIIQDRLQSNLGEATRQTQPIMDREFRRLDALWKRDRKKFAQEVNQWYNETPAGQ